MPELPEVETLRRELARVLVGQKIAGGEILWRGAIKPLSPKQFLQKIIGQEIVRVERRAKILLLSLHPSDLTLAIHLKMTGQLIYQPNRPFNYTRVILNFTDGAQLYFNDLRKFGWLKILSSEHKKILTARHGLEPLTPEFSLKKFQASLNRYPNRILKALLLDQTLIAGLGNIYVDESCFAAGVRPARRTRTLTLVEIEKLHHAIKRILKLAIKHGGTSARDYVRSDGSLGNFVPHLKVYGRADKPCRVCRTPITKIKLAGRGTHYCPQCQK